MKSQAGSINLISVIFITIIIATLTIAVNINFLITQKQKLQSLIDQTALFAVQEIDLASYYQLGLSEPLVIDQKRAQDKAKKFIEKNSNFENEIDLMFDITRSEIVIIGEVLAPLPLAPELIQIPISASAGARMVVGF